MEKCCNICKINKDIDEFYNTSNGRGLYGKGSVCKECQGKKDKIYREKNKNIISKKRSDFYNTDEGKEKFKKYYKKYYEKNKEIILPIILEKQKNNRLKINERQRKRYSEDPVFRLKQIIRRSILKNLKLLNCKKNSATTEILGCNFDEFKIYLESKFEPWMNWDNYGKYKKGLVNYGWDIDHIIPISKAKNEEDVYKLNHYTNLYPLCSNINRYVKKNNYDF